MPFLWADKNEQQDILLSQKEARFRVGCRTGPICVQSQSEAAYDPRLGVCGGGAFQKDVRDTVHLGHFQGAEMEDAEAKGLIFFF